MCNREAVYVSQSATSGREGMVTSSRRSRPTSTASTISSTSMRMDASGIEYTDGAPPRHKVRRPPTHSYQRGWRRPESERAAVEPAKEVVLRVASTGLHHQAWCALHSRVSWYLSAETHSATTAVTIP
jgi:hypothetical protein